MLPWRAGRTALPPASAVAVLIVYSSLVAALADVAQDQGGGDRQDREHEQRYRCAERQVVAPDSERECIGREDVRLINRPAIRQDLDDVEIREGDDQREQGRDLDNVAHYWQ